MSCSRKKHSHSAGAEAQISNPLIQSLMLYQLSHCTSLKSHFTATIGKGQFGGTAGLAKDLGMKFYQLHVDIVGHACVTGEKTVSTLLWSLHMRTNLW